MNEQSQPSKNELNHFREELQPIIEELIAVNTQFQEKVKDLESTNDKMSNLIRGSNFAKRKRLENKAEEGEAKYRQLFSNVFSAITVFDTASLEFVDVNKAAEELYGYSREEFLKLKVLDTTAEPEKTRIAIKEAVEGKPLKIPLRYHKKKDGEVFPVEISAGTFILGNRTFFSSVINDLTERMRTEHELLELQRDMVDLSGREQRRIGLELHDDIGQKMTALAMLAMSLRDRMKKRAGPESGKLEELSTLIENIRGNLRAVARGLLPIQVEKGLKKALRNLAAITEQTTGIKCMVEFPEKFYIKDEKIKIQLFRVAQEAVNNAILHGRPSAIKIMLAVDSRRLSLQLRDNGSGIGKNQEEGLGLGLRIMRYRANLIGGQLNVESPKEGGTEVTCSTETRNTNDWG